MSILDIASVVAPEAEQKVVGIRAGEKLHEQMIGEEDAPYTFEYPKHYKILPAIHSWNTSEARIKDGKPVPEGFRYTSDNNTKWMTHEDLRTWIKANRTKIGRI